MTLIAGIRGMNGLIISADTEESIPLPNALRTRAEKIHIVTTPGSSWKVIIAGAGDVDYVGMACDFIQDGILAGAGNDADIIKAIRSSIHEIWMDYATYEKGTVDLQLLIASWSSDNRLRFTVVRNAAVRSGRNLEAMGVGDSTFRSLADRYLQYGVLSFVPGDMEVLRVFMVYAMQQAKQTVPAVGGNTRIVTLDNDGNMKWEKSYKIGEIQQFFTQFDGYIRAGIANHKEKSPIGLLNFVNKHTRRSIGSLLKELERIENNPNLA